MPEHHFKVDDFRRFLGHHPNYGEPDNRPLYCLFKMDPEHLDLSTTIAKWRFIDRIYNANIGNFVAKARKVKGESQVPWLATRLHEDAAFRKLMSGAHMPEGLNAQTVGKAISDVHDLAQLIKSKLPKRGGDGPVSACSKYFHFHSNAHPVYDNDASSTLHLIYSRPDWATLLRNPARKATSWAGNLTYGRLCEMELELLRFCFPHKAAFTSEVKQLDHYLIACYRREWAVH